MDTATANTVNVNGYRHRQTGIIGIFLLIVAGGILTLLLASHCRLPYWPLLLAAAANLFAAASFWHLETEVVDGRLTVAFGPLRLARLHRQVSDIVEVTTERSDWLDGWGIHRLPGRSPIWNLHGFDCVCIRFRSGASLRIGSDDCAGLQAALRA